MLFRYGVPLIALGMLGFATASVLTVRHPRVALQPPADPPRAAFERSVAAAGIVEPASEMIAVSTPIPGVVADVFVRAGQDVRAGEPLFALDDREEKAELAVREAALAVARTRLVELESYPRAETLPPAEAAVAAAAATLRDASASVDYERVRVARIERASRVAAASEDELEEARIELERAQSRVEAAAARLQEAKSQLALLQAGSFRPSIDAARAEVARAEAAASAIRTTLERMLIRAPIDATVLRVDIRRGEYAATGLLSSPMIQLGLIDPLHVRVDIDEVDAARTRDGAAAVGYVRGDASRAVPLEFVRFEPFVIPERSLTGLSGERVDTRVLQAIYRADRAALGAYVGQQVDVYIDAQGTPAVASR